MHGPPTYFALYWLGSLHFGQPHKIWITSTGTDTSLKWQRPLTRWKRHPLHSRHLPHRYTLSAQSLGAFRQGSTIEEEEEKKRGGRAHEESYGEVLSFITGRGTVLPWTWTETKDAMICLQKWPQETEGPSIQPSLTLPEENDRLEVTGRGHHVIHYSMNK